MRLGSKKAIVVAVLLLLAAITVFVGRYRILQYSVEKIVRKALPDYITIEKMGFNFREQKAIFTSLKIVNPPGFSEKYLIEIGEMECRYRIKSVNIFGGVEILSPIFKRPTLYIERLSDGRTNLQEMTSFLDKKNKNSGARKTSDSELTADAKAAGKGPGAKAAFSSIVKLPEDFIVKDGKAIFLDGMVRPGRYVITFDDIDASLHIRLDSAYTRALDISTTGIGTVNGRKGETVRWDTKFDPKTAALTMSNRFNVSNVDITAFAPYYDKYSPFAFQRGYFSGTLIFDFDNGSIGSTNEVTLSLLSFAVKRGYENAQFLETTVPDLVKYFTSSRGDVIFDFKVKGRMSDPQFYLGPISKQAVASMAIDKIGQALQEAIKEQSNPQGSAAAPTSDMDKASEYIKMFKGLLKENE